MIVPEPLDVLDVAISFFLPVDEFKRWYLMSMLGNVFFVKFLLYVPEVYFLSTDGSGSGCSG